MYSLVKRQAEVEILPMALSERLGVIPYSPIGAGLLAGRFSAPGEGNGRLVENAMYARRYADPGYYEVADRFLKHAEDRGVHPVTLAVSWVASHPAVTAPIIGASTPQQLEPSLAALEHPLDEHERAEISALSPAPPPPTDRSEENVPARQA